MFQLTYYSIFFGLSVLLMLLYVFQWRKQFDAHMTVIFVLIPISNLAYILMYSTSDAAVSMVMMKIAYVGGIFLPWLTTMCVVRLCRIEISRWIRSATLLFSTAVFFSVLTIGHSGLFYTDFAVERVGENVVLLKEYGLMHTVHYVSIILYLTADIAVIIYSLRKKKQVSRRVLFLLFIPIAVSMLGYFANSLMPQGIELTPFTYVLALFVYLLIVYRMALYNVSEMVIETEIQSGDTGFITMDLKERYLGCNETAGKILPALKELTVDRMIDSDPAGREALKETVAVWLARFRRNQEDNRSLYTWKDADGDSGEKIYTVEVSYLYDGSKKCGYQIFLADDTQNQKYIRLMDQYNSDLQAEVTAKTERIVAMHDNLILSMAAMVESRDNSTGGHIRRTSEGVRILVETIREDGTLKLSDTFCRNIIKAAPMHDLGKIAVDDAILRKPGRFTPEEFEVMKSHAAKGAEIVHNILEETDDDEFRVIAENVAHYHHERMDGSGYPDGLKGEEIPLEARIMAIADVYDALVSKRVYKEKFSFDKADCIILEGMGTQFDARLRSYYEAARPRLEAFYSSEG